MFGKAKMVKYHRLIPALLCCSLLASCGGAGESPATFTGSTASQVTPAPTNSPNPPTPAQPITIRAVEAFPNLSLTAATAITHARDGTNRLFVAELSGRIKVFENNPAALSSSVFLDLSGLIVTGDGRGVLGLAFHPDYQNNGFFYVYYSTRTSSPGQQYRSVISRFRVSSGNPNLADPSSELVLLTFDQPAVLHDGGCLAFGTDGMLYISSGDGGPGAPAANGQSLTTLLGKILRLRPDGSTPADNPFVGVGGGVREEIWAYGLRNPWQMSFDPVTGTLWTGDVGENTVEEINQISRGGNYGWPLFEGTLSYDNPGNVSLNTTERPFFTYPHSQGQSITGGLVYRGSALPSVSGAYLYADFISGTTWALFSNGVVTENRELTNIPSPIAFGLEPSGEPLICSYNGKIYRLVEQR